jgi:protein-disulfide isomerase-like protein with CxxC motif
MRPLSLASIFAAVCSWCVGVAAAFKHAADNGLTADSLGVMVAGLSEAMVPPFVAFAFLSVAWLLVALGLRREAAR